MNRPLPTDPLRPRAVAHRGHVMARGLLIAKAFHGRSQVHARILAAYQPGMRVHDLGSHYVLSWPTARRVDARACIGEPLVAGLVDQLLCACPLDPRERTLVAAPADAVAWVDGGNLRVAALTAQREVDLGEWLDLDGFHATPVQHLGAAPRRPSLDATPVADTDVLLADARPEADAKQVEIVQALERRRAAGAQAGAETSTGSSTPASPGALTRFWRALKQLALRPNPIADALGRRYARYLDQTMELFERGDLDEALRRAIPTSTLGEGVPEPPGLSLPSPRSTLDIHRGATTTGASVGLPPTLFERMRELYAGAAARLEQAGRIEEAAFVYFDLLNDALAGVALLERHDRFALAAEIAEARELAPELVVRLWFLAKQPDRAIQVARRTGAFAGAVQSLERSHSNAAAELRLIWAEHEADSGEFVAAIEALWPNAAARSRARPWIDQALRYASPRTSAKLYLQKLELDPTALASIHALLDPAFPAKTADALELRLGLARELPNRPISPEIGALSRAVTRALLIDIGDPQHCGLVDALAALLQGIPDRVLNADLPSLPPASPTRLDQRTAPLIRELPIADVSTVVASDIAVLPDGGALVALGEAGVLHLRRDGRIRQHYSAPAHALVAPLRGSWALGLAQRDAFVQVWRIDVAQRSARWWQDLQLDAWAPGHDGGHWFAANADALFALDLLAPIPKQLWRVPLTREKVERIQVGAERLNVLISSAHGPELFRFDLPQLVLRQRTDLLAARTSDPPSEWPPLLGPELLAWTTETDRGTALCVQDHGHTHVLASSGEPRAASSTWLAVEEAHERGRALTLLSRRDRKPRYRLLGPGTTWMRCAIARGTLWGFDDLGRAWSVSLLDGSLGTTLLR